jgi:uncharacterized protein YggE
MDTPTQDRTLHIRPPLWLPIAVAAVIGVFYVGGKFVETRIERATIAVSGEGRVFAVPDIAELSFGVQTGRQPTAQVAMQKLQDAMNAIFEAVKEQGVEEKDIRTENLFMNPAYDWTEGGQIPRGFEASQSLRVKIRDLTKIGEVLSAATTAGANQVGGVAFTIDDPEELRAQAREEAIAQAKEKAGTLAQSLGKSLGKLRAFNEGFGSVVPPVYEARMMMNGMGGGGGILPVPEGSQEINVMVTLTYEVR